MEQRLANEDEDYPQGFSDAPEYEEEESLWDEYDYYDFPEDNEDGLFDPMEKEDIP